jgi:hypothetical protein
MLLILNVSYRVAIDPPDFSLMDVLIFLFRYQAVQACNHVLQVHDMEFCLLSLQLCAMVLTEPVVFNFFL